MSNFALDDSPPLEPLAPSVDTLQQQQDVVQRGKDPPARVFDDDYEDEDTVEAVTDERVHRNDSHEGNVSATSNSGLSSSSGSGSFGIGDEKKEENSGSDITVERDVVQPKSKSMRGRRSSQPQPRLNEHEPRGLPHYKDQVTGATAATAAVAAAAAATPYRGQAVSPDPDDNDDDETSTILSSADTADVATVLAEWIQDVPVPVPAAAAAGLSHQPQPQQQQRRLQKPPSATISSRSPANNTPLSKSPPLQQHFYKQSMMPSPSSSPSPLPFSSPRLFLPSQISPPPPPQPLPPLQHVYQHTMSSPHPLPTIPAAAPTTATNLPPTLTDAAVAAVPAHIPNENTSRPKLRLPGAKVQQKQQRQRPQKHRIQMPQFRLPEEPAVAVEPPPPPDDAATTELSLQFSLPPPSMTTLTMLGDFLDRQSRDGSSTAVVVEPEESGSASFVSTGTSNGSTSAAAVVAPAQGDSGISIANDIESHHVRRWTQLGGGESAATLIPPDYSLSHGETRHYRSRSSPKPNPQRAKVSLSAPSHPPHEARQHHPMAAQEHIVRAVDPKDRHDGDGKGDGDGSSTVSCRLEI